MLNGRSKIYKEIEHFTRLDKKMTYFLILSVININLAALVKFKVGIFQDISLYLDKSLLMILEYSIYPSLFFLVLSFFIKLYSKRQIENGNEKVNEDPFELIAKENAESNRSGPELIKEINELIGRQNRIIKFSSIFIIVWGLLTYLVYLGTEKITGIILSIIKYLYYGFLTVLIGSFLVFLVMIVFRILWGLTLMELKVNQLKDGKDE